MIGELSASFDQAARSDGPRRWRARTAARSRSSSTGAGCTAVARWARSPTSPPAAPSAPAPGWAARGTSAPAWSLAPDPHARADRRSSRVRPPAPRSPGRCPTRTSRPTGRPRRATDTGRRHSRRITERSRPPNSATATASASDRDVGGVDDRDHQQRAEIVDHRQVSRKTRSARRRARRQQRQRAERESGVGRHRRSPAVRTGAARVERQIDRDRDRHAAERGRAPESHAGGARAARRGRARAWPPARRRGRRTSSAPR